MNLLGRRRLAALVVTASLLVLPESVPSASAASGPEVSYPLRHDFSLVPGLPGHGKTEPTSCYDSPDGEGYICRIVAGYEETGYERNFAIRAEDALDTGHHRHYGTTLVSRGGYVYEGCRKASGNWACDYKTRKQVSR